MSLFTKIFGTSSQRELKSIYPIADKVDALEEEYKALTDAQLQAKTPELKERLANGETLDDILPEAFAACREAAWRVIGLRPYRVQVVGGIVLHQGRIAEMKTGEGKTLVATLPAYLNALAGKGVHVITVNDYLAKRDSEWMGKVFRFMGLTVGLVIHGVMGEAKKAAYQADITYGTNNEFGFDYLRDNMAIYSQELVQRGHAFAIVDEVDSILIDEARTPLIISGQGEKSTQLYTIVDQFVSRLKCQRVRKVDEKEEEDVDIDADYIVDEKARTATLTARGIKKAEEAFQVENLADMENTTLSHHINQAIKARGVMKRDIDYVVKDGQVIIVDEFTGRLMFGRRYNEGLHQAIEAKEGVEVANESKTLATITFQNYFRLYDKLSGMTGTALTEEEEFGTIYELDIVEIPTNRPLARIDQPDVVYKNVSGKLRAIVEQIEACHAKGQPVLVGTITIEASEELSRMLTKRGIQHKVLNAKFHELEAEIVADAGIHGAVTIATNMAGRGTDIKLDEESRAAGGLKIIGTERHESRRIDNQLRGRSGRQGDPGESKFYISLQDDLMRLFGSERLITMFNALGVPEDQEIEHKALTNAIESAQKKIENNNFGIRKNLLEYDRVMSEQREIIYEERNRVLNGESMRDFIYKMITDIAENCVDISINDDAEVEEWNFNELNTLLIPTIPLEPVTPKRVKKPKKNSLKQQLKEEAVKLYESKEAEFPDPEGIRELERVILLKVIDRKWMDHIDDMEQLRQGIGLQAYGQRDPLVEYKSSGYQMFDEMIQNIKEETVRLLFHIKVEQKVEREQVAKVTGTNKDESLPKSPVKRGNAKVYPNDPCPCGSGKKYKQCCGRKSV